MNLAQLALVGLGGLTRNRFFRGHALFHLGAWQSPALEGAFYWFVGTFVFYWWHRIRHANGFWVIFHQLHHSPSRIEVLTSFYKHPIEIASDLIITSLLVYCIFGGTAEAGARTSLFSAAGEYFYHANIRTPMWLGWFIQRPEHHSIHHELDVHQYNFGDITWWDRLFGTFKDSENFAPRCGFPVNRKSIYWRCSASRMSITTRGRISVSKEKGNYSSLNQTRVGITHFSMLLHVILVKEAWNQQRKRLQQKML
ncbi:sterol desaturase family protein [Paludibacterium denitrificans]|uniref:sterol desaturase family protein n=1 Tax=Paludibacterium denitrificans TaxID=2675226 RepID=UPI001E516598|nr:sterol desaturase family protein [Paludibacterium denitrificans]